MTRAISFFSSAKIPDAEIDSLIKRLQGQRNIERGWTLTRNGRTVSLRVVSDDTADMFSDEELQSIGDELGGPPVTRIAAFFSDDNPDHFEFRMAMAVSRAMAENWPILMDDHAGERQLVIPPGETS